MRAVRHLIASEQEAIASLSLISPRLLSRALNLLMQRRGKIIVCGIGKSWHISQKIAASLTSLGFPATPLHPGEAMHGDFGMVQKGDVLIALSQSGATKELIHALAYVRRIKVPVIAITGRAESPLVKMSQVALCFSAPTEGSPFNLAPMASAVASLGIGHMLAVGLSTYARTTKNDFARTHPGGSLGLELTRVSARMHGKTRLPLVYLDEAVPKVVKEITKRGLGVTGVISRDGLLRGVITDGDLRRALAQKTFSKDLQAKDIMTLNPKTTSKESTLKEALYDMEKFKITSLFVTTDGLPVGIIHMHHIVSRGFI